MEAVSGRGRRMLACIAKQTSVFQCLLLTQKPAWGKILSSTLQPVGCQHMYDSLLLVSGNKSREEAFEIPLTIFGKSMEHLEICRVTGEQVL